MRSVRTWLFFVMPVFALMAMAATELRRSTNPSADWRDLAINGRGYIHTVDENGENPSWLRFVRLAVNSDGLLCATVDGKLRPLAPPINIPSDWTQIDIDNVGRVTVNSAGVSGISIGSIYLTRFSADDFGDAISTTNKDNRLGPPLECEPGTAGVGFLMQRTSLDYVLPLTWRNIVIFAFALIWLSGGLWYTQSQKKP